MHTFLLLALTAQNTLSPLRITEFPSTEFSSCCHHLWDAYDDNPGVPAMGVDGRHFRVVIWGADSKRLVGERAVSAPTGQGSSAHSPREAGCPLSPCPAPRRSRGAPRSPRGWGPLYERAGGRGGGREGEGRGARSGSAGSGDSSNRSSSSSSAAAAPIARRRPWGLAARRPPAPRREYRGTPPPSSSSSFPPPYLQIPLTPLQTARREPTPLPTPL